MSKVVKGIFGGGDDGAKKEQRRAQQAAEERRLAAETEQKALDLKIKKRSQGEAQARRARGSLGLISGSARGIKEEQDTLGA